MSKDGIIIVVASIDEAEGYVVAGPDIVSRGFVYVRDNEELMSAARELASDIIEDMYDRDIRDWNTIKTKIRDEVSKLMYEKTKRSPMVLPIFMEV